MTFPMIILGVLAIFAGYINTPWFGTFLGDWLVDGNAALGQAHIEGPAWIMYVVTAISLAGILFAWLIYGKGSIRRDWLSCKSAGFIQYSLQQILCR